MCASKLQIQYINIYAGSINIFSVHEHFKMSASVCVSILAISQMCQKVAVQQSCIQCNRESCEQNVSKWILQHTEQGGVLFLG